MIRLVGKRPSAFTVDPYENYKNAFIEFLVDKNYLLKSYKFVYYDFFGVERKIKPFKKLCEGGYLIFRFSQYTPAIIYLKYTKPRLKSLKFKEVIYYF